jgi:hypothetical protein
MTSDAKRLIKVFLEFSDDDKQEVSDFIKDYYEHFLELRKERKKEKFLNESGILGPVSSAVCPYCGK